MQKSLYSKQDNTGQKGVFFSFIVFLIAIAVFAVSLSISQSTAVQSDTVASQSAFDSVSNRFNDIYNRTISIKTGSRGEIQGRILPFTYHSGTTDGTYWMTVEQYLPMSNAQSIYDATFDSLNMYEIFAKEKDITDEFSTTVNAQKNTLWGGTATDFTSVILPQCLSIEPAKPSDTAKFIFRKGTTGAFGYCPMDFPASTAGEIKKMEITLEFSTDSDVLAPTCGGSFNCSQNACTTPDSSLCVEITLEIPSCDPKCGTQQDPVCCITDGQKIAANIADGSTSTVNFPFNAGGAAGITIENPSGEILKIQNLNTKGILATAKTTFANPIQGLRFNGFTNIEVSKQNFDITRKSN